MKKKDRKQKQDKKQMTQRRFAQPKASAARAYTSARPAHAAVLPRVAGAGNVLGTVVSVKERFGFVKVEDQEKDIFVPGRMLMGAMPGDVVELRLVPGRGESPEGEVRRIVEPCDAPFTAVFHVQEDGSFAVEPDKGLRFAMKVAEEDCAGAKDGDKVLARVTERGERHFDHVVKVLQTYGSAGSAAACAAANLDAQGVQLAFDPQVEEEADALEARGLDPNEVARRLDLRGETIFTIDSAHTKDIDDAISLKRTADGWALGVHIADVSHYVTPGSALDETAFDRGTSIYYADSVIPMLPKALSNGICSLNEGEDRLAFSALMQLDRSGKLRSYEFKKTVIRSRIKGVYAEINALYDDTADQTIRAKYAAVTDTLFEMRDLAEVLTKRRFARGGLDLSSTESQVIIGEDGTAVDIVPRTTGVAERMIEEFMLTANEAAATFGMRAAIPFVYRVHPQPTDTKLEALKALLELLGLDGSVAVPGVDQKELSAILESVRGTPKEMIVNNQLLRSMAKAVYSPDNIGHYGLVMDNYAHFTSPIRRYPDLAIHRIMSSMLGGMSKEQAKEVYGDFAPAAAEQSSKREQRAMQLERDCDDFYKAEYMGKHIGEAYEGIISSVTERSLYIELPNTVEGMVRADHLPEGSYEYDGYVALTDTATGRTYKVGDRFDIVVAGVDVSAGNVDFMPAPVGTQTVEEVLEQYRTAKAQRSVLARPRAVTGPRGPRQEQRQEDFGAGRGGFEKFAGRHGGRTSRKQGGKGHRGRR